MNTENIQKFLMPPDEGGAYTDEKLAALLAHAQDGKLSYYSCCCLIGIPSATHALETDYGDCAHYVKACVTGRTSLMAAAESDFSVLGDDDIQRRERLIPLILAEMERREKRAELDPRDEEGSDVRPELEVYRGR